ncbi:MAG TPA: amino acid adenylation domain-containing protein [Pseudomonas sp.]|uniref:amino acid adenylation domain-containing protein n=1 Tax=Pseudomonas sp. TaxID=306 RepID=UPI002B46EA65|nr:amino acid adenylation domain-containing protein [Pseudomonas sp.]HKS13520.1 amino acid adenylation domain-containing protein [Pseudomonas sp.]
MDFIQNQPLLNDAQQGIWYASLARNSSTLYSTAQALELRGALELDRLATAIDSALEECQTLHYASFSVTESRSATHEGAAPRVRVLDLRARRQPARLAQRLMRKALEQADDPLQPHHQLHCLLIASDSHAWWFSRVHHLAFDAYAYHLMHRRAAEHYQAEIMDSTVGPSWFTTAKEVHDSGKAYRESERYAQDRVFWLDRLGNAPAPTFIEAAGTRSSGRCHSVSGEIEPALANLLHTCASDMSLPLPDVLLGAIVTYLARLNGVSDIVVGLPVSGRRDPATIRAPLTCSNVMPLVLHLGERPTLLGCCTATRDARRMALKHQRYRGEWIARELNRVGDAAPLHGIEINLVTAQPLVELGPVQHEVHHLRTGPARDLNVHLELDAEQRLSRIRLFGNCLVHTEADLRLHLERITGWLALVARSAHVCLPELPVTTPAELRRIEQWNRTGRPLGSESITQLFERQALVAPRQPCVEDERQVLDFAEVEQRSRALAHVLARQIPGIEGKVIGVAIDRSVELLLVALAVLRAGAVFLPLNRDYPAKRLEKMLERAEAVAVIADLANTGEVGHSRVLPLTSLLEQSRSLPADAPALAQISGDSIAYVLFTSGTSGEPKGVMINHRALANRLCWMQAAYGHTGADRVLQKTPVSFDVCIWELFWPLISGATLVMARPGGHADPAYLASTIESRRITAVHFVPSMLALFLDALERRPRAVPLRQVFASGEALNVPLAARCKAMIAAHVFNLYGPTEAAIDVTSYRVPDHPAGSIPIGQPIWNTQIHILDGRMRRCPIGVAGELFIGGCGLADGYIGQPALTSQRFIAHEAGRLYRTGDLARWRHDGQIEYLGRLDDQVKLNGVRIELDEIAAVLLEHPRVSAACAVLRGEQLLAYAVHAGVTVEESVLSSHLRQYLPEHMVPRRIMLLDRFALTANGKLDRKALPLPVATHDEKYRSAANLLEQRICEIFGDVLGLDSTDPHASFFELGGHSLSAIDAAARINAALGWHLSIADLFAHPSARALASRDAVDSADMLAPTLLLRPGQSPDSPLPTLFCIHPAGGIAWCYSGLARFLKTPCEIVGIQARGLTPDRKVVSSMEEMAHDYAAQIRAHQPQGPYWLIGWSVGGMIAQGVGACLRDAGEEIGLLAMMDAYPSDLWRRFAFDEQSAKEEESMALAALLFIAGIRLPSKGGLASMTLAKGQTLERAEVISLLRQRGNALASLDNDTLDRLINVVINSRQLVGRSSHRHFAGDLLFFTAARPRAEAWLKVEAWRPHIGGNIINLDIDCDHPGMARSEALRAISAHLDDHLAQRVASAAPRFSGIPRQQVAS